jgi:alpha-beta hydrolase superfamily lysophospholipase
MKDKKKLYKEVEGSFTSSSKANAHIYYKHLIPLKEQHPKNRIHVIFQHGMIEHQGRHTELYDALFRAFGEKLIVSVMDLFGHGLSGGDRGHIEDFQVFIKDYEQFSNICFDKFYLAYNIKTILGSHSLGGLISIKAVTDKAIKLPFSVDAMFFSNPCISAKMALPKGVIDFADSLPELVSKVKIPLIYNAYDLTGDEQKAQEFIHDHLISKSVSIKLGVETYLATKQISSLSYFFDVPSLFILSDNDKVVDNHKTKLFITGMDKELVKMKVFPNTKHDILNETCRNDVFQEIIDYIKLMGK